jgi:cephalosporin-C deacetylase
MIPATDPRAIPHPHPFDPTYGCTPEQLHTLAAPPAPGDFADFWRGTRAATEAEALALERGPATVLNGGWRRSEVRFTTLGGFRCGAWLLEPATSAAAGLVYGHGYGGPGEPPAPAPGETPLARLHISSPGFSLSAAPGIPDSSPRHVVHGIAARDTYLIRTCVAALWSATSALAALVPAAAGRLGYVGGSFGGGLGALALPWEPRWRCARLDVPTFGHHPWRLRCPCVGSGEAVRAWYRRHPEVVEVLAYYDAAAAAGFADTPTLCLPAYFDPAVPPPGQWAVANALRAGRICAYTSGHHEGPWSVGEGAAAERAWCTLMAECLGLAQGAATGA